MNTTTTRYRRSPVAQARKLRADAADATRQANAHRAIITALQAITPADPISRDIIAQEIHRNLDAAREMDDSADIWMDEAIEILAEAGYTPEDDEAGI